MSLKDWKYDQFLLHSRFVRFDCSSLGCWPLNYNFLLIQQLVSSFKDSRLTLVVTVDGSWGSWRSWGPCLTKCGGGVQTRRRYCSSPWPRHGGLECAGNGTQHRECNTHNCPGKHTYALFCSILFYFF